MKKIIFRADGNSEVGLGHLYRIFALIEIFKSVSEYIILTKTETTTSAIPNDYKYEFIPGNISIIDEPLWISQHYPSDIYLIIVDGYHFNSEYQKALKGFDYKLIYIDDQIKDKMYADIVINHALSLKPSFYNSQPNTKFALGTSYAILRPLFLQAAGRKREIKMLQTAFVCFGGSDPNDLTFKATKALLNVGVFNKINVIIGAAYKHTKIREIESETKELLIYQNLTEAELIGVMENSDFAIAPSSTIVYELCCIKMPILSGYSVDNQKNIYEGCVKSGCVIDGGNFQNYTIKDFENQIKKVTQEKDYSTYLSAQMKMFDAKIKHRFIKLIYPINYRMAAASDMLMLYDWSNEKETRANSYHSEPIDLQTHEIWFHKKLKDSNTLIYIAEVEHEPVGIVRYEIGIEKTIVGVIVNSKFRGKGLASFFLSDTAELYFEKNEKPIFAYIKKENIGSKRSFEKANYVFLKEEITHGFNSYVYKKEKE